MAFRLTLFIFLLILNLPRPLLASEPRIPKPVGPVNDYAGVILPEQRQKLESIIRSTFEKTGIPIVILTMPEIAGFDHNEYANLVYNKWGIGKKGEDKGVLIFITIKERKMRIETGYGVEGILPDGLVGEIRDKYMIPYFRKNRFGEGLLLGTEAISQILTGKKVESLRTKETDGFRKMVITIVNLVLFISVLILILFQRSKGRLSGGHYMGTFGWGGGSFGSSFGGFGGGMSGGGGASGSF